MSRARVCGCGSEVFHFEIFVINASLYQVVKPIGSPTISSDTNVGYLCFLRQSSLVALRWSNRFEVLLWESMDL